MENAPSICDENGSIVRKCMKVSNESVREGEEGRKYKKEYARKRKSASANQYERRMWQVRGGCLSGHARITISTRMSTTALTLLSISIYCFVSITLYYLVSSLFTSHTSITGQARATRE